MSTIKPLPQSLRSSVRSGIVLFDLTRVVEELVFNSLDASATKVSVFIGVGTFSLKVVDNGSGITRDDLVLLGERYATSKCRPSDDTGATFVSYGSRGEALASISDVSLVEIRTKIHRSPNGYRKVLKGCKCLHLGIDDDIKDVGTIVIVRDLFYNQPIRQKYIQSSPRKVLDSIKKCLLRIALVHTEISFEVIDIESGNELLSTEPSSSPLSLLRRTFGVDISNALRELKAFEGVLKLTGHMSGPCDDFSFKAFQYVYINSQFISKGLIHKVVNQLAAKFEYSNSWEGNLGFENGKRSRPRACPAYLLSLTCPRSLYDLSFEPSKTYVEFKEWNPILAFVENAVQHFWKENITEGKSSHISSHLSGETIEKGPLRREGSVSPRNFDSMKKFRFKSDSSLPSFFPDFPSEETGLLSKREIPFEDCHPSPVKFWEQQDEMDSLLSTSYFPQEDCSPLVKCTSRGILRDEDRHCRFGDSFGFNDTNFTCAEGNLLEDEQRDDGYLRVNFLGSTWKEKTRGINSTIFSELEVNTLSSDSPEDFLMERDRRKPFLQHCSSRGNHSLFGQYFASDGGLQTTDFKRKHSQINPPDDDIYFREFCPMRSLHEETYNTQLIDIDNSSYSRPRVDSFSWSRDFTELDKASSSGPPLNSNWRAIASDPLLDDQTWDGNFYMDGVELPSRLSSKRANGSHLPDKMCSKFRDREETGDLPRCQAVYQNHPQVKRSGRSCSAPPFQRQKRRFNSLGHLQMMDTKKSNNVETSVDAFPFPVSGKLEHNGTDCSISKQQRLAELFSGSRQETQNPSEVDPVCLENDQDSMHVEVQDSRDYGTKWRETCMQKGREPSRSHDENKILDVSSGFLYLAGDSLVPKSITKDCLFNAKVLQQVDKKFIPVVAGGTLAVIDQHAADERIRLEDLRQKVLSGEAKTISYLDSEKELLLPEIGYQLLHDYGEQIKGWGWICNIHSQSSGPFTKNLNLINNRRTAITLLSVPCILGVNLTDADLLEFLQQLVDTDGASTMPPAVVRILNLKACRGAIMFGDSLLPSECSLIVEELKQTELCFQCAHGRPTTVPLVNLDALRKQIPKLCAVNDLSNEPWHGLRRYGLSLERSAQRLRLAMS